jgi:hypothetical protein
MDLGDQAGDSPAEEALLPAPSEHPERAAAPARLHLVVVTTRPIGPAEPASPGAVLRTRFWHPRDRRWSENDFESLDHARRLFVEESGWVLRQEQGLDAPLAHELIFESRRIDFTRPSQEQILREIGMTPKSVTEMLEQVDRDRQDR